MDKFLRIIGTAGFIASAILIGVSEVAAWNENSKCEAKGGVYVKNQFYLRGECVKKDAVIPL